MRRTLTALGASLAIAGAAGMVAGSAAQAQPYGYYQGYGDYGYRYAPPRAYGYDGRYTPYSYYNGSDYYGGSSAGLAGAIIGSLMGGPYGQSAPYDRYGPDPNGMIAPDGHRIKCKTRNSYDSYYGRYVKRRECW